MVKPETIITALAVLIPLSASASNVNRLECRRTGSFSWGCKVANANLADQAQYDGESFETTYRVDHSFACSGHRIDLQLSAGDATKSLKQGSPRAVVEVTGAGSLAIVDPNPGRTQGLTFMGDCELKIHSVDALPSATTLSDWAREGEQHTKLLRSAMYLYLLAKDYEAISSWTGEKLAQMRDRLEQLSKSFPTVIHYRVLLNTVVATIENTPPLNSELEVEDAANALSAKFLQDLDEEVAHAQSIIDRFDHFKQAVDEDLKKALSEVQGVSR